MSERLLNEKLGGGRPARWQPVVETLAAIWVRTLYGFRR
jgi:hypothetical protein